MTSLQSAVTVSSTRVVSDFSARRMGVSLSCPSRRNLPAQLQQDDRSQVAPALIPLLATKGEVALMLPTDFVQCFESAATRQGNALHRLEWPSGGKDAPCHEVNAVFSFAYCLGNLQPQFDLYAEGNVGKRGR